MADGSGEVPPDVLARMRAICAPLPEAVEAPGWRGVRWTVRRTMFAHLVPIEADEPPAFARAVGITGPALLLTVRSSGTELEVLRAAGPPYFPVPWSARIVGMVLDGPDWTEIAELVTDSWRVAAPKRLAARLA